MEEQTLAWRDVEADVHAYLNANGAGLTIDKFRYPRGGTSGRKYIGMRFAKLQKLDPIWVRLSDEPCDYDDSLWRGVRAYESFCELLLRGRPTGQTCAEFCDEILAR